jgi:hypothetical protein
MNRLVAGRRTSGDAALRGAERDIGRMDSIGAGWERLCEVAWELGVTELHLAPQPVYQRRCPEFHSFAPEPEWPPPPEGKVSPGEARWSVAIHSNGECVADLTARRPLSRMEFDPGRFAGIVEGMVKRHLSSRRAS